MLSQLSWLSLISLLLSWGCPAGAQEHSKYIQAVDEYRPAPGQYVNDAPEYEAGDTEADMIRKCNERLAGLSPIDAHLVALGGWGGYITFHFDHPVANIPGQRDFAVWGNAYQEMRNLVFGGMNEAGIVMVSQDTNGNGLPDDTWYEISGSCDVDSVGKVIYDYEVTYRRNPMADIPWTDNQGNSGTIDRNHYHEQEYFPMWLTDDELSFRGTRLPDNMVDLSTEVDQSWSPYYYVLMGFRYGYADNLPNFTDDADATSYNVEGCGIDISWAVDEQRQPVSLDHIDFVRVYTGLNQKCPQPEWWGETSTEFMGAEDLHLEASLEATGMDGLQLTVDGLQMNTPAYDLQGRKYSLQSKAAKPSAHTSHLSPFTSKIIIQNGKKFILK
jgi:hypothetical protein